MGEQERAAAEQDDEAAKQKDDGEEKTPSTPETSNSNGAGGESSEQVAEVVDSAVNAAEGTRNAARWIASALGAIPGLAIIGAVVRDPGDAGFASDELLGGLLLAALGALLGILVFAYVLAPAGTEESDVSRIDPKRVPGHPFTSYEDLRDSADAFARVAGHREIEAAAAEQEAKEREAELAAAELQLLKSGAKLKKDSTNAGTKAEVERDKAAVERLRHEAQEAAAEVAGKLSQTNTWREQFDRLEALRGRLYQLAAADEVRRRFEAATVVSFLAVAMVAAGVGLIGLAPIPDSEAPQADPVSLHTLVLNEAGRDELNCDVKRVQALRVGGEEERPQVITLPSTECPLSRELPFSVEDEEPLGAIKEPTGEEPLGTTAGDGE